MPLPHIPLQSPFSCQTSTLFQERRGSRLWMEVVLCAVVLCCFFSLLSLQAEAWEGRGKLATGAPSYARCLRLYEQKRYKKAARCYLREAEKIEVRAGGEESRRLQKGYFYREASRSLEKAAQQSKRIEVAAYLRERALRLLEGVLERKLVRRVRGKRRGRLVRNEISKLRSRIGYTSLAISTDAPRARIQVKGYHYEQRSQGRFHLSLRPGAYLIRVHFPQEKKSRQRRIMLRAGQGQVLTFLRRPGAPLFSWVGYTAGGAVLLGGAVTLALGVALAIDNNDCFYNDPSCSYKGTEICRNCTELSNPNNEEGYQHNASQATILGVAGGVALAAGVALVVAASLVHARATQQQSRQQNKALSATGQGRGRGRSLLPGPGPGLILSPVGWNCGRWRLGYRDREHGGGSPP